VGFGWCHGQNFGERSARCSPSSGPDTPGPRLKYPFWHLGTAATLWEVHGLAEPPTIEDITAVAGLTRPAAVLLRDDAIRAEVISLLLDQYLSDIGDHQVLLERVGLVDKHIALPDADTLLRILIGVEIRTATWKPNTVLAVHGDTVLVRTDRSRPASRSGSARSRKVSTCSLQMGRFE
jgi:hypothetical protein